MATQQKALHVFASSLGCQRSLGEVVGSEKSTLPCFLAHDVSICTLPSLRMADTKSARSAIEQLDAPLQATKRNVGAVPQIVLQNSSQSFGTMIDERLPAVLGLTKHESSAVAALVGSGTSIPTSFTAAETRFRPLSMEKGFVKELGSSKAVILPLVFKLNIDISFFGAKSTTVTITAPGTIIGTFSTDCQRIMRAEVAIDTETVYRCMSERCDEVVVECLRTATELTSQGNLPPCEPMSMIPPTSKLSPAPKGRCGSAA